MILKKLTLFAVAVWLMGTGSAQAENNLQLTNEVFQEVEIKGPDGKIERKRIPAETVIPGTVVYYVITYRNVGQEPAHDIVITNPIPKELEYISTFVLKSVADVRVSIDGGKAYDELIRLDVKDSNGKLRPARASDVTHVRWSIKSNIGPGEEGKVSYEARLK